jgi:MFS family permease
MKYYLAQFRDQVFNGSLSLYKRVFFQFLILNIVIGLISLAVYTPLVLKLFSWNFSDLVDLQTKMEEMGELMKNGGDPSSALEGIFGTPNYIYMLPLIMFGMFMGIWSLNLYYQLNDAEIRNSNRSIISAVRNSFSPQLFSILGFMILYYLLSISSFVIFMALVVMIMQITKVLGIIIGFIGFFFLLFFILRFSLGFAAIVHGKMSISEAFAYSFTKITFKRAAMLLLMGIVTLVVMGIASGIGGMIVHLIVNREHSDPMTYYLVNQIFGTIMGVIVSTFIFTGSSALYFRYSNDEDQENDELSEHLINN